NAGGLDAGSAYVFVRSGTAWTQQQKVTASDGAAADQFGTSVSLSADTAVVGSPADDLPGAGDAGSGYVFVRTGTTWTQQAKLVASDAATGDLLGQSVAISGDTVVAGAPGDDVPAAVDAGSADVFVRAGTTWTLQPEILPAAGAPFGSATALSGDTVVLGAPDDGAGAGSAYVFVRSGTLWSQQQKLLASDGTAGDHLGLSVSLSADTVVVG